MERRTEVIGVQDRASLLAEAAIHRLVGAILLEENDEWTVQRARYMTVKSVASVSDHPIVGLGEVDRTLPEGTTPAG